MAPLLALESISKRFGAVVVADNVNLALAEGEALGIIGPNGAGKTTLFGIATGTVAADEGRVLFAGKDITRLPPERRCRKGIARSFQIPQPFSGMTVFENVVVAAAFGVGEREAAVYDRCGELLERCGLAEKANKRAGGLTLLDRKRLELARALATKPRVLLLDEVAGGLTDHECAALVAFIRSVRARGVSIIWIEHVVHALLAAVDRLLVLHGGKFIADGDPRTVIHSLQVAEIYMGIEAESDPLLEVRGIDVFYGDFQALFGVLLCVNAGEVVTVIGANGAGKSTLLKSIAGLMPLGRGDILFDGARISAAAAFDVVKRGIALVPEGRRLFPSLTVEENLLIGGQSRRPGPWTLKRVYELFPVLAERRRLPAPALSGGQQQMAAIARALMSNPRLLLCDEISLGLAPIVVRDIYARLPAIVAEGLSLIVVEQDIAQALKAARQVYCLQEGRIALQGQAGELTRESISAAYFGV